MAQNNNCMALLIVKKKHNLATLKFLIDLVWANIFNRNIFWCISIVLSLIAWRLQGLLTQIYLSIIYIKIGGKTLIHDINKCDITHTILKYQCKMTKVNIHTYYDKTA